MAVRDSTGGISNFQYMPSHPLQRTGIKFSFY